MEAALTALLASVAGGRRWWIRAPQDVRVDAADNYGGPGPYLVLSRVDGIRDYVMSGPSGYIQSRFQIDVYGATFTSTKAAADAAISALSGYRSGNIKGVFIDSERNLPAADAGDVTNLFRTSIDILVHHTEE